MVQYIITPWRNQAELLKIRDIFYPEYAIDQKGNSQERKVEGEKEAVARVAVWVQRGNCPHLVESTAILTSAILNDRRENEVYCVRAAYAAAFCRFVTGLLDSHQNSSRKQSMYSLAKTIGLPATYVELRHQATHEELPSLSKLRAATQKALRWIYSYYWADLLTTEATSEDAVQFVQRFINEDIPEKREQMLEMVEGYEQDTILEALMSFQNADQDVSKFMRVSELQARVYNKSKETDRASKIEAPLETKDVEEIRREMESIRQSKIDSLNEESSKTTEDSPRKRKRLDSTSNGKAWAKWEGPKWVPKPIGVA